MPAPATVYKYLSNAPAFQPASAAAILPCSMPVFSQPFEGVNVDYVLEQDFSCFSEYFQPLGMNTPHPDYSDFILCKESPRRQLDGNVVQWTRTYCKKPDTYSLASSFTYTFPAFQGASGVNINTSNGRDKRTRTVSARVQYDYFLIDGSVYKKATDIPTVDLTRYYVDATGAQLGLETDTLTSNKVATNPTVPSVEDYLALVTAKTEIVTQCSLRNWLGRFVERQTIYILPQ